MDPWLFELTSGLQFARLGHLLQMPREPIRGKPGNFLQGYNSQPSYLREIITSSP